jgi:hypothetical protein
MRPIRVAATEPVSIKKFVQLLMVSTNGSDMKFAPHILSVK